MPPTEFRSGLYSCRLVQGWPCGHRSVVVATTLDLIWDFTR